MIFLYDNKLENNKKIAVITCKVNLAMFYLECYGNYINNISFSNAPDCVQRVMMNEIDGRIYIFTTSDDLPEFLDFIKAFEANTVYYEICESTDIKILARVERAGFSNILVDSQITPGSVLVRIPKQVRQIKDKYDLDALLSPSVLSEIGFTDDQRKHLTWTVGFLARDKRTNDLFIVTCGHCVKTELDNLDDLVFLSSIKGENSDHPDGSAKILHEISSSGSQAFYGPYSPDESQIIPYLIDILLLKVNEELLTQPQLDMAFRYQGQPIQMEIFSGDMQELLNMKVSMWGCISGKQENKGQIVDTNVGALHMHGDYRGGIFAVALDQEHSQDRYRIALEGDSGTLIYGTHPTSGSKIAIGLVLGSNNEGENKAHIVGKTNKSYKYVTYCTILSLASHYIQQRFQRDIEFHVPHHMTQQTQKPIDGTEQSRANEAAGHSAQFADPTEIGDDQIQHLGDISDEENKRLVSQGTRSQLPRRKSIFRRLRHRIFKRNATNAKQSKSHSDADTTGYNTSGQVKSERIQEGSTQSEKQSLRPIDEFQSIPIASNIEKKK